jgi:hypothetical protein
MLVKDANAAYVFQDPQLPWFAHEYNVPLIGQQLDIPVMNGTSGSTRSGYKAMMRPREVLEKGTKFDFAGFAFLVHLSLDLKQARPEVISGAAIHARPAVYTTPFFVYTSHIRADR